MDAVPHDVRNGGGKQISGLTCPDCCGVLQVELIGPRDSLQFTCRIGHTYAALEALEAKEETLEERAWGAIVAAEELAALLRDLKQRDMLKDTLVILGGEFGRTSDSQGSKGRDHNPQAYTTVLAGGGVLGGKHHGKTDEFGYKAVEDKVDVYDIQATVLHLLGLDHTKLTYRHNGRDFRLTDVAGNVIRSVIR